MRRGGVVTLVSGGVESCCLVARLLKQGYAVHPLYVRCGLSWERAERFWLARWLARLPALASAYGRPGRHPRLARLVTLEVPVGFLYGRHWSLTGRGVPSARTPDSAVYLPGRNVLLLAHAAVYAAAHGCSRLAIGTLAGNPFGDASHVFFKHFAGCLSEALSVRVRITTPLRTRSKHELINTCSKLPLHVTFSCIHPRDMRHCGRCNKCAERRRAFRLAGVPDLTLYAR